MTNDPTAFVCRQCGHCCEGEGGIVLAAKDQQRLADHLKLALDAFLDGFTRRKADKIELASRADGYCVFFEDGCAVHPARPNICRAWPFFRGNLLDASSWELSRGYCPGINPTVSHDAFAEQGLAYIQEHALAQDDDPDGPNALRIQGIPKP